MSLWVAGGAVVAGIGGSLISANAANKAQGAANAANQNAVNSQNQAAYDAWLASRGVSPGTAGLGTQGGALNTSLPIWAQVNGTPAEQYLLNSLFNTSGLAGPTAPNPTVITDYASLDQIEKFLQTPRGLEVVQEINDARAGSDDTRSVAQWLADHIQQTEQGTGTFSQLLKDFASAPAGTPGSLVAPPVTTPPGVPQNITDLNNAATNTANSIFSGSLRAEELQALQPVLDANTALAALQYDRNAQMRTGSNNILNTELAGLEDILATRMQGVGSIYDDAANTAGNVYGSRKTAAQMLFDAENQAANNTYGARRAGAQDIYGADLKYADTYSDATKQALQRVLAQQTAANAVKGFAGESSNDALLKARTLATGYQQSAGARAGAGQTLAQSLAKAGELQAIDLGTSGIRKSDTLGKAGVSKSQDLGLASAGFAKGMAGATEMSAMDKMKASVANATRLAGILDADAAIAGGQAKLNNANATAAVTGNDISRRLANLNIAPQQFANQTNITNAGINSQFANLDSVLSRLGAFRSGSATPPTPNVVQVQPNITSGQTFGSALGAIGQGVGQYYQNQQLIDALRGNQFASNTATGVSQVGAGLRQQGVPMNQWNGVGTNSPGTMIG